MQALDRELYKEKKAKYIEDESTEIPKNNYELRSQIAELLKAKVASCNKENFIVKPNLEYVERFEKKSIQK